MKDGTFGGYRIECSGIGGGYDCLVRKNLEEEAEKRNSVEMRKRFSLAFTSLQFTSYVLFVYHLVCPRKKNKRISVQFDRKLTKDTDYKVSKFCVTTQF